MPPYNTTLMGVAKGALDYYKIPTSAPTVFGASGHAFMINIHEQLCPSGPYCWNREAVLPLLRNLGLEMIDLGFYSQKSSPEERLAVEKKLKESLDQEIPCSLINLENQLITGYSETAFYTLQPWSQLDFPPARLTFGAWKEFGETFHANFFILKKSAPAPKRRAILDALDYAVDLHANPTRHSYNEYGVGPDAYALWIKAVETQGNSHGHWWNATVWSECRQMASLFFAEIQRSENSLAPAAGELVKAYAEMGDTLGRVSDKQMPVKDKIRLIEKARDQEAKAIANVAALAAALRPSASG